jgi:hypothetical protein
LDLGDAVLTLTVDESGLVSGFARAKTAEETAAGNSAKSAKATEKSWADSWLAIGVIAVATATALIKGIDSLIKKWAEADRAQTQLNFSVQSNANLTVRAAERLTAFAEETSRLVGIDEELIKTQLGVEATFGLTETQIKDVMTAALNLSATGMVPLELAVRSLSGSFDGSIGMLGRYVPQLRGMTKDQLEAGDAIKVVNDHFKDMAETLGTTLSGQIAKLNVAWKIFIEQVGYGATLEFGWLIKPLTDLLTLMAKHMQASMDLRDAYAAYAAGTETLAQHLMVLNEQHDQAVAKLKAVKDNWENWTKGFKDVGAYNKQVKDLNDTIAMTAAQIKEDVKAIEAQAAADKAAADAADKKAKAAAKAAAAAKTAKEIALQADQHIAELEAEWGREDVERLRHLSEELNRIREEKKEAAATEKAQALAQALASDQHIAELGAEWGRADVERLRQMAEELNRIREKKKEEVAAAKETAKAWKDAYDAIKADVSTVMNALTTISSIYFQSQTTALDNLYKKQSSLIADQLQTALVAAGLQDKTQQQVLQDALTAAKKTAAGETDATKKAADDQAVIDAKAALDKYNIQKKYADMQAALDKSNADAVAAIKKKQWEMNRDISEANVVISTAEAIVQTFTQLGFTPWGIAAAALMTALGAVELGVIVAEPEPTFASGGDFTVPPGYPNDSYPMHVESGEHVSVTPAGQGGDQVIQNDIYIDGTVFATWITKASRDGRILTRARSVVP